MCPLCKIPIQFSKGDKIKHCKNIAHIYPLNPSSEQKIVFGPLPRLSEDPNSVANLILLCPNCHYKNDSISSASDYMKLYNLKKKLIEQETIRNTSFSYNIDDEIRQVIRKLYDVDVEKVLLEYDVVEVKTKLGSDFDTFILKSIQDDVVDYYSKIRQLFYEMELKGNHKFDLISSQIKTVYLEISSCSSCKEDTYSYLCQWFSAKVECNMEIARIMIAFFIQNCEVFDVPK